MALQSMTGFGRMEVTCDAFTAQVEIKSVNHRFKDYRFRIPSSLNAIELVLKKIIGDKFKRGSFDISVSLKREKKNAFDSLDKLKVRNYLTEIKAWSDELGVSLEVSPTEFLRSEFFKEADESLNDKTLSLLKECFLGACLDLEHSRIEEGAKLEKVIIEHRDAYHESFVGIEKMAAEFEKNVKERLLSKFNEVEKNLKVDEPRYLQEVIYYLEKMDVHEEINRIHSHLEKLDSLTRKDSEVGRQMEFILQELNRETNTIGSKSSLADISDRVIKMKVELEKLREQSLNLE